MNGLLHSRKFWLAVFGMVSAIVLNQFTIPDSVWNAITELVMVLIAAIAAEDVAEKIGAGRPSGNG